MLLFNMDKRIIFMGVNIEDDRYVYTVKCSDLEDKKFVEDLFSELAVMSYSDDDKQPFLFTDKILDVYFRGSIKNDIRKVCRNIGAINDRLLSEYVRNNKFDICNRLCGIISSLYDVK